ncbi:MAG: beta-N-acetylhexosaminidase [Ruminiclostridium sp.]|nr:beta-N-acetylhexosaminidase [Ruminiclostridium sp.]
MKIKKSGIGILLMILLVFAGCSTEAKDKSPVISGTKGVESSNTRNASQKDTQETVKEIDPIEEQINSMTLKEKIGQMVIVGLEGYKTDENAMMMIKTYHVGGFILFGRNVEDPDQLLALINSLKTINSESKAPLFISVDEEGGRISRMPDEINKLPSNEAIGRINKSDFSYKIGNLLAEELSLFGFNMDFAPVLDIFSNPKNSVIGDRSFGPDAGIVSRLGTQTMKGIREGGVIPVVKHFPGHGDTLIDSHVGLPSVDYDMERLAGFELVPFKEAIDNQAEAVMVAHILLKKIDPEYPATLSKTVITDVLRNQLNFKGVVITDDMTMGAIVENYDIGDAAVKSVNAGSDIVLVCHEHKNRISVLEALLNAADNGVISEKRVNESVYRILKLKNEYRLKDNIIDSIDIESINNKISTVLKAYK